MALTKKAPEPQVASKTLSSWSTLSSRYMSDVIWSGVKTCPASDFFLYLENSLKKIPMTSSPFQWWLLIISPISATSSIKALMAFWSSVIDIRTAAYSSTKILSLSCRLVDVSSLIASASLLEIWSWKVS